MDNKTPWQKIKTQFQKAATNFLSLPFHKKTGYFLLLPPALGVINFLMCTCFTTTVGAFLNKGLRQFWLSRDGASSPIPIFLGLMAIAGAYLIKDKN